MDTLTQYLEQNKDRSYETLEESSRGWHEGAHNPWPFINYVLFIMKTAYLEFADRVGETKAPRGSSLAWGLAIYRMTSGGWEHEP